MSSEARHPLLGALNTGISLRQLAERNDDPQVVATLSISIRDSVAIFYGVNILFSARQLESSI